MTPRPKTTAFDVSGSRLLRLPRAAQGVESSDGGLARAVVAKVLAKYELEHTSLG